MPGEGPTGGLLVVGGSPGVGDDQSGQPFSTEVGRALRRLVEQHWTGPVRFAYGVSCRGGVKVPEASFEACAPYLAGEIEASKPQRILVVGSDAARAVLGQRLQPTMVRRAWANVRGVPAFLVPHPQSAQHNRFVKQWMEEDVRWALRAPLPPQPAGEVRVLWEPAEAVAFLGGLQQGVPVAIDIENVGDAFKKDWRILCLGIADRVDRAHVLPEEVLRNQAVRKAVSKFLADPQIPKVGQFIKYDINGLHREFGVELAGLEADTGIQRRLIESDAPAKLGVLAWLVGFGGYKKLTEAQMKDDTDKSTAYAKLDPDQLHAYNGRDCCVTLLVHQNNHKPGRFDPYKPVWRRLVRPALGALAHVERTGALLSRERVAEYDSWLKDRYRSLDLRLRAHKEVSAGFNPNSDKQVQKLLFSDLKLPSKLKTDSGAPSVAKKALEAIKDKHPIVPLLMEMATVDKQVSTYGLPMLDHLGIDGRIHTTYGFIRSGRLSSKDPNLQNITAKGEEGHRARACWVASPGHVFLSLDYSQLELRVLADLSGDKAMAAAFERGSDFHLETAAELARIQKGMSREAFVAAYGNGTDGEKWAIDLRKAAKNINFGLVFGQGDTALAEILNVSKQEAGKLKQMVLSAFPSMAAYQSRLVANANVTGEVWTDWAFGCRRRRNIYEIGEIGDGQEEGGRRAHAQNIAKNHPIQGTASEYMLASLIEVVQRQQDGDLAGKLVLTVHDELDFEVPEGKVEQVAREVRDVMTSWPTKMVKLKVDCEVGADWGNLARLELS